MEGSKVLFWVAIYPLLFSSDMVAVASVLPQQQADHLQPDPMPATEQHQQHPIRHHHGQHHQLTCPEGQFVRVLEEGQLRCTNCSTCPEGFGVKRRCEGYSDTTCERCNPGQGYLRNYFGVTKCFKCKMCGNREVVRECSASVDRVCGACKPGYFLDDMTDTCLRCSYCYPEIPNYGVVEPMCQSVNQPPEMTCLPSLSPYRHLRQQPSSTAAPGIGSAEGQLQFLEEKMQRLSLTLSGELVEVMAEIKQLRETLSMRSV